MEAPIFFIKGLILGIAISMPVGPVSILCIQRTLFYGIKIGLITAIGSALADGIYASIAAFGLKTLLDWLIGYQTIIRFIGILFLCFLAISIIRSSPKNMEVHQAKVISKLQAFVSAFFITITNPITIFSFIALIASAGLNSQGSYFNALYLVFGLVCGSILWEFLLSVAVKYILKNKINQKLMQIINYISGSTILIFMLLSFKM